MRKYLKLTQKKKHKNTRKRDLTMTLADDVRRGISPGENSFLWKEGMAGVWGWKIMYLFLLPNKRKDFLYHNIHDLPTLVSFFSGCILSEPPPPPPPRRKIVNEPSRGWWWNFIVIFSVHICMLCVLVNNLLNHVIPVDGRRETFLLLSLKAEKRQIYIHQQIRIRTQIISKTFLLPFPSAFLTQALSRIIKKYHCLPFCPILIIKYVLMGRMCSIVCIN